MANFSKQRVSSLFHTWAGSGPTHIEKLPTLDSDRAYYRLSDHDLTAISTYYPNRREHRAFLDISQHFASLKLPIPKIYAQDSEYHISLQEDLGDTTLFSYLTEVRPHDGFSQELIDLYKKAVQLLPRFQIEGGRDLDYRLCYPRQHFDYQSMMWDLNYFRHCPRIRYLES